MEQQQHEDEAMNVESTSATQQDDDSLEDDASDFIDMNDVVEVDVDDDIPMDDDDDDDDDDNDHGTTASSGGRIDDGISEDQPPVVDMSKAKLETHSDSVYAVATHIEHGNLMLLSGGGDDKSFLHKIASGSTAPVSQALSYNHTDTVSCVAFNLPFVSDDLKKTPRLAAVGSYDGTIAVYDPDTLEHKLKLEGPSDIEWISFHPKGGSVLLAGSGDGTVWMFHIPLNRCLQVFVGHEQSVTAGCFSPDGKWALSASGDGTLRVWAPKTGMNKHVFRTGDAGLTCIASNGGSDGMLVMVGAEDGQAHVCHIGTKKVVASLRHNEIPPAPPVPTNDDEEVEMEYPMSVEAVGFFPAQPNWCATAGVDGKLKVWDLAIDGQCRQICNPPEGPDSISRLQWHPKLPLIFTFSTSGKIRLWDARSGKLLVQLTGHTDVINDSALEFLENGNAVIATAGDDKTVRVFDVDVNDLLRQQTAVIVP